MQIANIPIRRKLMIMMFCTSVMAMFLMLGAFFIYEFQAFRQATTRQLSALGGIISVHSTAALAFDNRYDATETLAALRSEPHLVAAALYTKNGVLFAKYPASRPDDAFPSKPSGTQHYQFQGSSLDGFQPVVQGNK